MKKLSVLIAMFAIMLGACSTKNTKPAHLIAVPKDATIVLAINGKQIAEKSGLNKIENFKFYSLIEKELSNLPEKQREIAKKIIKNTRESGLNLDEVFYYIYLTSADELPYIGITCKMDDKSKFEKILTEIDDSGELKIENKNEYSTVTVENVEMRWNDKILSILMNSGDKTKPDFDLMNTDETKSILTNADFTNEYAKNNDMCLYANYGYFMKFVSKMNALNEQFADKFDGLYIIASMNDQKGQAVIDTKLLPKEKMQEIAGNCYKDNFDKNIYKYFPNQSLINFKLSLNPMVTYEMYKGAIGISKTKAETKPAETNSKKVEILDKNGKVTGTENAEIETDDINTYANAFQKQLKDYISKNDEKIKTVISCFTGDVLANLSGLAAGTIPMPLYQVALGIADGKQNEVISMMEQLGFAKKDNGSYQLSINGINVYFAINNNIAYITGDTESVAKFLDKGYDANITSIKNIGSEIEKSIGIFYINLNIEDYPAIIKSYLMMSPQGANIMPFIEKLKSIVAKTTTINEGQFRFELKDNSDYTSKIILKLIDEIAAKTLNL